MLNWLSDFCDAARVGTDAISLDIRKLELSCPQPWRTLGPSLYRKVIPRVQVVDTNAWIILQPATIYFDSWLARKRIVLNGSLRAGGSRAMRANKEIDRKTVNRRWQSWQHAAYRFAWASGLEPRPLPPFSSLVFFRATESSVNRQFTGQNIRL